MSLLPELLKNKRVLIVEDDRAISELISRHFHHFGCEVLQAYDGLDGLAKYKEYHPDVLILDLNLPEINGNEIIHEIRKLDQDVAIIVTTAYADLGDNLYAIDALLIKPISQKQISSALEEILLQKKKKQKEEIQSGKQNILLFSSNPMMEKKIRMALKDRECQIYHTDDSVDALELLERKQFHFIYVHMSLEIDIELELVRKIKEDVLTKWIPLCVITSQDEVELRQELFRLGINDYLVEPFFTSELGHRYALMIEREGTGRSSLTIRVINATVKLFKCEELAYRMESVARIVCDKLGMETDISIEVSRAAKYMSIAVEHIRCTDAIEYLRNLHAGKPILNILSNESEGKEATKVVKAILQFEKSLVGSSEEISEERVDEELMERVKSIYDARKMLVHSMRDIDYIQSHLERYLKERIQDKETQTFLNTHLKKLLHHSVIYHRGALFEIEEEEGTFVFVVKPEDERVMKHCIKQMQFNTPLPENVLFEYVLKTEEGLSQFRLGWHANMQQRVVPESNQKIKAESEVPSGKAQSMDAVRYVQEHPLNDEEKEYFNSLEDEMLEILEGARYKEDVNHAVMVLSDLIYKYANAIIYFNEFSNISEALFGLGQVIRAGSDEEFEEKKARQMIVVLDSIISNLVKWRQSIFIDQNVEDIHYLDDSIMADCDQFLMMLHPASAEHVNDEEDDNDLELF